MFHPYAMITGFFADDVAPTWQGPLGNILMSQEFYETIARAASCAAIATR